MVDYTYYKETFGGTLTETEFHKALEKAKAYLRGVTRGRALPEDTNVYFCLCELCDIFSSEDTLSIASESCDGFSVSYHQNDKSPAWKTVCVYLAPEGVLYGGTL